MHFAPSLMALLMSCMMPQCADNKYPIRDMKKYNSRPCGTFVDELGDTHVIVQVEFFWKMGDRSSVTMSNRQGNPISSVRRTWFGSMMGPTKSESSKRLGSGKSPYEE